ncbi:hypothetical protein ACQUW5_12260 [Legionella sp. CNM-1927-20]|uniref:hypothetical protein n=1 Tax=Legionella sp. CNM-1927-20 TaxID=3422221 RepID=UPI00403B0F23
MANFEKQAKDTMQKGLNELEKSGCDWLDYVQKHPLQIMFFGLIGYFAVKGIIKD